MAALARFVDLRYFSVNLFDSLLPKPLHAPAVDFEEDDGDDDDDALESTFTSVFVASLFYV